MVEGSGWWTCPVCGGCWLLSQPPHHVEGCDWETKRDVTPEFASDVALRAEVDRLNGVLRSERQAYLEQKGRLLDRIADLEAALQREPEAARTAWNLALALAAQELGKHLDSESCDDAHEVLAALRVGVAV